MILIENATLSVQLFHLPCLQLSCIANVCIGDKQIGQSLSGKKTTKESTINTENSRLIKYYNRIQH